MNCPVGPGGLFLNQIVRHKLGQLQKIVFSNLI